MGQVGNLPSAGRLPTCPTVVSAGSNGNREAWGAGSRLWPRSRNSAPKQLIDLLSDRSLLQVYAFLAIAYWWEIEPPAIGYLTVLPALILTGLMLGALGMLISSAVKQLENFAGVMNFVIFPMFFASSALYPLWRVQEASPVLYYACLFNPFTHAVELIRFALYGKLNLMSLAVVCGCTAVFMTGAILAYDPSRGLVARRGAEQG